MPVPVHPFRQLIQPGIDALRRLWLPFVLVQLTGVAIVTCYFNVPAVTALCDRAAEIKASAGMAVSALAMSFASGVVPEIFKTATGVERTWNRDRLGKLVHNLLLFFLSGVTVDLLYTGLGAWLGDSRDVRIVATKVIVDQFMYTPFFAIPLVAFTYTLRNTGYSLVATWRQLDLGWYGREVMPVLVVCWAYWIPMVTLAYLLPPKLTFVYSLVASAAASTLLIAIASRERTVVAASTP